MPRFDAFVGLRLRDGFIITQIESTDEPLVDTLGRVAAAQTTIIGQRLSLRLRVDMDERELSLTLYHEILEAVAVGSAHPPEILLDFNEGDFELAAQKMHGKLGPATPETLNRMLQLYDFPQ
jgi:hypothetical protein